MLKARSGAIQYAVRLILILTVLFLSAGPSFSTGLPASASPVLAPPADVKPGADPLATTIDVTDQPAGSQGSEPVQPEQPAAPVQVVSEVPQAADANGDGCTNLADFNILKSTFGSAAGTDSWNSEADFNSDNVTNIADFVALAHNFGHCSASSDPTTGNGSDQPEGIGAGLPPSDDAVKIAAPPPTRTPTPSRTPTRTSTSTITRTPTRTSTSTRTATSTSTLTRTSTPTGTSTSTTTFTQIPTSTSTSTSTPVNTSTNTPTSTDTPVNTFTSTPVNTPTSTPTSTNTGTATDTPSPGTSTVTPTPTQPVLLSVAVGPNPAAPASLVVLTYTLYSPGSQQVSLGAAMRQNGTNNPFTPDPINDRTVSVVAGTNTVIRYFALPNVSNVSYDIQWGLWSAGFGTQYGLIQQDNALDVSGPTPTPIAICNYYVNQGTNATIVPGTFQVERSQCTDCTVHIDIPFVYTLYNQQFTVIHAGNNGNVQFPTFTGINNGCLPEPAFNYTIVPYWEDLDTTAPGDGIFTSVSGTQPNRILNIEWRAHTVANGTPVHFEARIYEGLEKFDMIYDQVDNGGSNASTGVQLDTTNYQIYQCQAGGITPGMILTYEYACGLPTQTPTATWTSSATPTVSPTNTGTATNTVTATFTPGPPTNTPTATATPTQPVLQAVSLSPNPAYGGQVITLNYTVWSPNTQVLSLGGDMAPAGTGAYVDDPANNTQVTVNAGINNISRLFNLGTRAAGGYDVRWGLFAANFGTQYGLASQSNALTILAITVTPTNTATATDTPPNTATNTPTNTPTNSATSTPPPPTNTATSTATPTQPVLQAVDLGPNPAFIGQTIVFTYTVWSPNTQVVSLGGDMAPTGSGAYVNDPANDAQVTVNPGLNTVTRFFNLGSRAAGGYDVRWGLFAANFGTQYGLQVRTNYLTILNVTATPTNTNTPGPTFTPSNTPIPTNTLSPTPGSPTATPSTPQLQAVALAPTTTNAGDTIVLTYTVWSPNSQVVSLGADMAPAGTGAYQNDAANDRQVTVNPGVNNVTRLFDLGSRAAGGYDVRWGLFAANFGTQYGLQVRTNALTILAATVTPTGPTNTPTATPTGPTNTPTATNTGTPPTATNTPLVTNTPTPSAPTLNNVSLSPASIPQGGTVTLNFTIFSPAGGTYALGADINNGSNQYTDPGNDRLVTVPAGVSNVSRGFYIRPDDGTGVYSVSFGLWNSGFTTQYGSVLRTNALTITGATPTPSVGIPTYTATTVSTPNPPGVTLDVTQPSSISVNAGGTINLSYRVINNTEAAVSVKLGASLVASGQGGSGAITDAAHETVVSAAVGTNTYTRSFVLPATISGGSYDLTWSLINPSNGNVISTRTVPNLVWVVASTAYTGSVSLASASLASNSITLVNGQINRITGNFSILNELASTQGVIVRMRIKQTGTTQWINDLGNDSLVNAAPGTTNISRNFIIPRYIAAGTNTYDVIFEIGDPDFNGAIDNTQQNGILTITNPARIANVGVPILMYHNVNPTSPGGNWVKYDNFVQQMNYLSSNGWHTITGEDMYNYIYKGTALPTLPIWITFDDSYQNVYDYAYPVMNPLGLKASIFANTQWMGQMNSWDICCEPQHLHMTWNMLGQMVASGFAADSHTQHHVHFFDLQPNEQQAEVWGTQTDLVSFLGAPARNFSYPYGQYPDSAEWAVAHSGFHAATIIGQAKQHTDFANMFELTRIGIADSDTLSNFITKITAP